MLNGQRFSPDEDTSYLYKFKIEGYHSCFGYMLQEIVELFSWPHYWEIDHQNKTVQLNASNLTQRNKRMNETLIEAKATGTFKFLGRWSGEVYSVYDSQKQLVVSIERTAAPLFGIVTYGVQLLAYRKIPQDDFGIWIARRAKTKRTYPSLLDSTVGGGLPTGETPFDCLIRESAEEASFSEDLIRARAKACGTVNYMCRTDERAGGEVGLFTPEVQFTYEMELPPNIIPRPGDNEAEEITFMTVDKLRSALAAGEFTPANGCIVLDFLIRHGFITYEQEKDYIEIASRLHRPLGFPTA